MTWHVYRVVLRLHTPMHIGWGTVSYLQRARPYVIGRVLRGALVSRTARNDPDLLSEDPRDPYRRVSKTYAQYLTYTYFYPALKPEGEDWKVCFPWEKEADFRRSFLSSYAGTALEYPQQTAAEGLLREIEFISPHTLDTGDPVYLMGYIFAKDECLKKYDWRGAFNRLQLGGERGYGWGEARAKDIEQVEPDSHNKIRLFGQKVGFDGSGNGSGSGSRPTLTLSPESRVWAHVIPSDAGAVSGPVEPVVGREWRAEGNEKGKRKHIGQHIAFNGIHFAPGSVVLPKTVFSVEKAGYWQTEKIYAQSGEQP